MTNRGLLLPVSAAAIAALLTAAACGRSQARSTPLGNAAASEDPSTVVAEVGGERITLAELDRRAAGRLAGIRHDEYEARRQALDEMLEERLIEREAASRSLTREALF